MRCDIRLVGTLGCLKLLPKVLVVDFGITAKLEDDEADGCLCKDEHLFLLLLFFFFSVEQWCRRQTF